MTPLIILGCIAAYFGIGWCWAIRNMPRAWARARENWAESAARETVMIQTVVTTFLWPVVGPALLVIPLVVGAFSRAIDRRDPRHREREIERREQDVAGRESRISQLERELGIGKTP